jgi:GNAT superfamily N-acetyltransferase
MDVIVRGYASQDLVACRVLWVELTQQHRDIYDDPTIGGDDPGAYFDATYLNMDALRGPWVAERGGHVVGLTGLFVHGTRGEIEPVVVANSHRLQGIGTALLAHVVAEARVYGIQLLTVRPVARNSEAIAFFVREGFMALGQIDLTRDLSGTHEERWKPGVMLHGHELKY